MNKMASLGALAVGMICVLARGLGAQPTSRPAGPVLKTEQGPVEILPADNPWNTPIDKAKAHPRSDAYLKSVGLAKGLHPDFGTVYNGAPMGIPFVVVGKDQKKLPVAFEYAGESDRGPYPIPDDPPIEGGPKSEGDRHVLIVSPAERKLYELYHVRKTAQGWTAGSGAIFDLTSNKLRPAGWTSADAAGLPIFPGLARYDEAVEAGAIRHALRFTVLKTQRGYIAPATHYASRSTDENLPPMGLRVRLKAGYDITKFPKTAQVILQCLKTYGMILADNGGDWYISGAPHSEWNDEELNTLRRVKGSDLEAVYTGEIVTK